MKNVTAPSSFASFCRICSCQNEKEKLVYIFESDDLLEKITSCLPITIHEGDELPHHICAKCLKTIENGYDLINKSQSSEKFFFNCLKNVETVKIKIEEGVEEDTPNEQRQPRSLELDGTFNCDLCDVRLPGAEDLDVHIQENHVNQKAPPNTEFNVYKICSLCGELFDCDETYVLHKCESHPDCPHCHKTMPSKCLLNRHITHSCKQLYFCPHCHKTFSSKICFMKHVQEPFCIVDFLSTSTLKIVPATWLRSESQKPQCYWPPYKSTRLKMSIMLEEKLDDSWELYNIKIVNSYKTYEDARRKLNKAEEIDDLSSSDNRKRKRKQPRKHCLTSSESSDEDFEYKPDIKLLPMPFPDLENDREERTEDKSKTCDGLTLPLIIKQEDDEILDVCDHTIIDVSSVPDNDDVHMSTPEAVDKTSIDGSDVYKKIVHKLGLVHAMQQQHSIMLREITANLKLNSDCEIEMPEGMPILPVGSKQELLDLEQFLTTPTHYSYVCKILSTVGGSSTDAVTRKAMARIMTSELAMQYNWKGRPPKTAFKHLKTKEVIVDAVRRGCGGSDLQIENAIKVWLRFAGARLASRKKN